MNGLAFLVSDAQRLAIEHVGEGTFPVSIPVALRKLLTVGPVPRDVFYQ